MSEIAKLRNLGPVSAKILAQVGVWTKADLANLGAREVFHRVIKSGQASSDTFLYALEGALQNKSWKDIAKERTALC